MKIQFNMKDTQKFVVELESLEQFQDVMKKQEIIWQGRNGLWVNQGEISSILFEKPEEEQKAEETHVELDVNGDTLIVKEKND